MAQISTQAKTTFSKVSEVSTHRARNKLRIFSTSWQEDPRKEIRVCFQTLVRTKDSIHMGTSAILKDTILIQDSCILLKATSLTHPSRQSLKEPMVHPSSKKSS